MAALGLSGAAVRRHEFHHSEIRSSSAGRKIAKAYRIEMRAGNMNNEGHPDKNCLASYVHLHFGSNPDSARSLVAAADRRNDGGQVR
jgi:cobyrinic acid a,c-diamide synthase